MIEVAFFRAFLAWETFLEESFSLYLAGQKPPRGRAPYRYAFPPNYKTGVDWLNSEGQGYANWTRAQKVSSRAERFFRNGKPFSPVLQASNNAFEELRILRNAIAHASVSTQQKFESLVRNRLLGYPAGLSVGGFLGMIVPGSSPPSSFLESYLLGIESAARQIIPQ